MLPSHRESLRLPCCNVARLRRPLARQRRFLHELDLLRLVSSSLTAPITSVRRPHPSVVVIMSGRKRPRQSEAADQSAQDNKADCPFSAYVVADKEKEQKHKKRRKTTGGGGDEDPKLQASPFSPSGTFKTHDTMDVYYRVEPSAKWTEMTRYNSFVCTLGLSLLSTRPMHAPRSLLTNYPLRFSEQHQVLQRGLHLCGQRG